MEIKAGGLDKAMSQKFFDSVNFNAGFKQMSGKAVTDRMNGERIRQFDFFTVFMERVLDYP